jgi:DNA-directed RNA polymerase specialized sigma24 family protein
MPETSTGWDDADDTSEVEETSVVRPYAVTGGRTRPTSPQALPFEALVQSLRAPVQGMTPEKRSILDLTAVEFLSIAELSAHVKLPVGVVRVIVSDLADEGKVRIHGVADGQSGIATSLSVLESVLNGISSL